MLSMLDDLSPIADPEIGDEPVAITNVICVAKAEADHRASLLVDERVSNSDELTVGVTESVALAHVVGETETQTEDDTETFCVADADRDASLLDDDELTVGDTESVVLAHVVGETETQAEDDTETFCVADADRDASLLDDGERVRDGDKLTVGDTESVALAHVVGKGEADVHPENDAAPVIEANAESVKELSVLSVDFALREVVVVTLLPLVSVHACGRFGNNGNRSN
jgi:hypothetical protein